MILNTKFKTTLCRNFEVNGKCHMTQKCHFAHGKDELRHIPDPLPKLTPLIHDKNLNLLVSLGITYIPSVELVKNYLRENALKKLSEGRSRIEVESASEEL